MYVIILGEVHSSEIYMYSIEEDLVDFHFTGKLCIWWFEGLERVVFV